MRDNFYDLEDNCVVMPDGSCVAVVPCIHSVVFKPVVNVNYEQVNGEDAFDILYDGASSCRDHMPVFERESVESVVRAIRTSANTDSWGCGVVRLKDGRFATIQESEDYTGHG